MAIIGVTAVPGDSLTDKAPVLRGGVALDILDEHATLYPDGKKLTRWEPPREEQVSSSQKEAR